MSVIIDSIPYGVTATGFVLYDLDTIQADLQVDFQGGFGANLELDPREPAGQLIGILADRFASLWELAEDVYLSNSPDDAIGVGLDTLSAITGAKRTQAFPSLVTVTATGAPGTLVSAARVFKTSDSGSQFQTIADATVGGGGTVSIPCESVNDGPVIALAGTLNVIVTPVAGLTSVTNPLDAVVGALDETDPALRITREEELQGDGGGTVGSVRAALLLLSDQGVTAVNVFENDTNVTDGGGLPPWSIECLVTGGTDALVEQTILDHKGGGISTHGTTSGTVLDEDGNPHTIAFSRPTVIPIYVAAALLVDVTKYPLDGDAQVKAAMVGWGDLNLKSGRDVVAAALSAQAFTIPGVLDCVVDISLAPSPTLPTTIAISLRQQADLDTSRTTVASTPSTP